MDILPTNPKIDAPTARGGPRRMPELDGLRGLAILMVFLVHYLALSENGAQASWMSRARVPFKLGWSGVDLFFVLSGFLIGGILLDAKESPRYFRTFYLRRLFRILPIYFAWLGLFAVVVLWAPRWLSGDMTPERWTLSVLPLYFVFLQSFGAFFHVFMRHFKSVFTQTLQWYWLAPVWSLAVEEQFYLITPALVRWLSRKRLTIILFATVVLAPVLRLVLFVIPWSNRGAFYYGLMPCRADALAMGVLAALALRTPRVRAWLEGHVWLLSTALAPLAIGYAAMAKWSPDPFVLFTATIGYTGLGVFYTCALLVVLLKTRGWLAAVMRWSFLRELGTVSYCMYLIHLFVLAAVCHAMFGGPVYPASAMGLAGLVAAALLTWGIARTSWMFFERPLLRRGQAYAFWPAPVPATAGLSAAPAAGEAVAIREGGKALAG